MLLCELPVPPGEVAFRSVASQDTDMFLATGKADLDLIRGALSDVGFDLTGDRRRILDWGCGSGRIARHWQLYRSEVELHGCDIDELSASWCRDNIPFGTFSLSDVNPPLPYVDEYFDIIYGISVLTHMGFDMQYLWMRELWRLLKSDGAIVVTIHGPSIMPAWTKYLRDVQDSSVSVILVDEEMFLCINVGEGLNTTGNVQTHNAFRTMFAPFAISKYMPRYGLIGIQDTYVLTKKSDKPLGFVQSLLPATEMNGSVFCREVSLSLAGQRTFSVLAKATGLFWPTVIRASLTAPGAAPIWSERVSLPDKVSWTMLESAYASLTIEGIPDATGPAVLRIEVESSRQMERSQLQLRNAVWF